MRIDPGDLTRIELNALVNGLVAPRPIAWVSTISASGTPNLAPFSFFNAFSFAPPMLAIGPGSRDGVEKDTLQNINESGEFVVSVVTEGLAQAANRSSADFDPEIDEWRVANVSPAPSTVVAPARVAESPAAFECRVAQVIPLSTPAAPSNSLVLGRVVMIHVAAEVVDGLSPLPEALQLVGRMGGSVWVTTRDRFSLERPASTDPSAVAADHGGS